ncbi:MarR family transcriptional regulator [Bacillus sp. 3255]|uniref:GbsR/MarR family transcriptional regulator n=1 Tax=Bacillus sp. 3255 TaxID=2817904 RepID=UPI00286CD096|nr:MarR family transcriptional regulator [Bacillus sp. 3255]
MNYEKKGFSPLVGKIFAQLLFATGPLSLQDIVEQLGVTKAAVSVQIRHMERVGMCRKMPSTNDRRDYYYMSESYSVNHIRRIVQDLELFHIWAEKTMKDISSIETCSEAQQESLEYFEQRFSLLAAMYDMLHPMIKDVEKKWEQIVLNRKKAKEKE